MSYTDKLRKLIERARVHESHYSVENVVNRTLLVNSVGQHTDIVVDTDASNEEPLAMLIAEFLNNASAILNLIEAGKSISQFSIWKPSESHHPSCSWNDNDTETEDGCDCGIDDLWDAIAELHWGKRELGW